MFKSFYFVIHQLTIFDALIQNGFGFFPKITIGNLCEPFNNVIFILISIFLLQPEKFGQEGGKFQTFEYLNEAKKNFR